MNSLKVFLILAVLMGVTAAIKCKVGVGVAAVDVHCTSNFGKCLTIDTLGLGIKTYSCGTGCGALPRCSSCNYDLCNSATGFGVGMNHLLILGFLQSVIFLLVQ